jgi:hypothetical protein
MFVESSGGLINIDAIETIEEPAFGGDARLIAQLRDKASVRLNEIDLRRFKHGVAPVIPSPSGFEWLVVMFGGPDEELLVLRQPILGWSVCAEYLWPVVIDAYRGDRSAIKKPDCSLYDIENETDWSCEAQWLVDMDKFKATLHAARDRITKAKTAPGRE